MFFDKQKDDCLDSISTDAQFVHFKMEFWTQQTLFSDVVKIFNCNKIQLIQIL